MRAAVLYARMLRYRVAAMLWLFLLLAAADRDGLSGMRLGYVWATLALASSYVAATAVNDVADREIDRVNHPRDRGRPLVTGEADERDLRRLHAVTCVLAVAAALPLGAVGAAVVLASLAIGRAYSLRPLLLSYRPLVAPPTLAIAYVLVPYALGLVAIGGRPTPADLPFAGALLALFLARIVLKDFRDREGDRLFGKATLLLRFGRRATCTVSAAALVAGDVLLLASLRPPVALALLLQVFVVGIAWLLASLARATSEHDEQVAIGLGARLGNGLLTTTLAWLILSAHGAPLTDALAFAGVLTALFVASVAALATRPAEVVIGYKG
jgi:4-hydroxybenzoate polyprenyltransferase